MTSDGGYNRIVHLLQPCFIATRRSVNIYCSVFQPQHVRDLGCIKAVLSWQEEREAFCVTAFNLKETALFPALSVSMAASLAACTGVSRLLEISKGVCRNVGHYIFPFLLAVLRA